MEDIRIPIFKAFEGCVFPGAKKGGMINVFEEDITYLSRVNRITLHTNDYCSEHNEKLKLIIRGNKAVLCCPVCGNYPFTIFGNECCIYPESV